MANNSVGEVSAVKQTYKYKWVINNFCIGCKNVGGLLTSPEFSTSDGSRYKWRLWLYPKGNREENKDYLSIFLYNHSDQDVTAAATYSILNHENKVIKSVCVAENTFKISGASKSWGLPQFVKQDFIVDRVNNILTNDKLIIECEITLDPRKNNVIKGNEKKDEEKNSRRLQEFDSLQDLIDEKEFSDVAITVEGKTLHVHKCILAKRSPVFAAMFHHEMKEKRKNKVDIKDVKHNVFVEMLRYMYSGKVNDIDAIAPELLAAADKYSLDGLKDICETSLCENLTVGGAVESLKIADRYRMEELKAKAIEFIVSHAADFVNKPEFRLLTEVPEVLFQVCRAMGNKKK